MSTVRANARSLVRESQGRLFVTRVTRPPGSLQALLVTDEWSCIRSITREAAPVTARNESRRLSRSPRRIAARCPHSAAASGLSTARSRSASSSTDISSIRTVLSTDPWMVASTGRRRSRDQSSDNVACRVGGVSPPSGITSTMVISLHQDWSCTAKVKSNGSGDIQQSSGRTADVPV